MTIHSVVFRHLVSAWMSHTLPVAVALCIVLVSCAQAIGFLPFLIWLHFPAYLIHQCEEYVFPGGFKHAFSMTVGKMFSHNSEACLSDSEICIINVVIVWFGHLVCCLFAQHCALSIGVLLPVFALFNALLHIIITIRMKYYNPGVVTSVGIFIPLASYTLYQLHQNSYITFFNIFLAITVAVALHAGIIYFVVIKARAIKLNKH